MKGNFILFLAIISLFISCNAGNRTLTNSKESQKVELIMSKPSKADSIKAALQYQYYGDKLDFESKEQHIIKCLDSISNNAFVFEDTESRDIRIGVMDVNALITWKLLDGSENKWFDCNVWTLNFDNKAKDEIVVQYRRRTLFSSETNQMEGNIEIWSSNGPRKYFSEVDFYSEDGYARNGDGSYSECKWSTEITPLKIKMKVEDQSGDCSDSQDAFHFCLVNGLVEECE